MMGTSFTYPRSLEVAQGSRALRGLSLARALVAAAAAAAAVFTVLFAFGAFAPAALGFEQVSLFGNGSEGGSLLDGDGMAVNVSGAGGVPAGTLYAVTGTIQGQGTSRVLRFDAQGQFREAWGAYVAEGAESEPGKLTRCGPGDEGPGGAPPYPHCNQQPSQRGFENPVSWPEGVAVDQSTGDVYVLNLDAIYNGHAKDVVEIFNSDGSQLIGAFGQSGVFQETSSEGPEKFHNQSNQGIAVDNSGTVYITDRNGGGGQGSRIMVFKPQSAGNYEKYVFAGGVHVPLLAPGPLAVDSAGNVYVAAEEEGVEEFVPGSGFAPGAPDEPFGQTATPLCKFEPAASGISGMAVNPANGGVFFYSDRPAGGRVVHELGACSEGSFSEIGTAKPVPTPHGPIEALAFDPGVSYDPSRPPGILYAIADKEGPNKGEDPVGYVFASAAVNPPLIEEETVSSVSGTAVMLGAEIDTRDVPTHYSFQYLTEAEYEAAGSGERFAAARQAPLGGSELQGASKPVAVEAALSGLMADTEYRYRVVAENCKVGESGSACETAGADASFHTYPVGAGLPDGRAWEMVSPPSKDGGEVFPINSLQSRCFECTPNEVVQEYPRQSAPDGDAIVYQGQSFSPGQGSIFDEYISKRTASGWQTEDLTPPLLSPGVPQGYEAFDTSLSRGLIYQFSPSLASSAPGGYENLYAQPSTEPLALEPLLQSAPPNRPAGNNEEAATATSFYLRLAGSSADLERDFVEANDALTGQSASAPAAVDGGSTMENLYEWSKDGLALVNVLPGNETTVPGAAFGSGSQLDPTAGSAGHAGPPDVSHAISTDGARAFWTDETSGRLYVRENGQSTVEISDPGSCSSSVAVGGRVCFLTASADGSRVLLSDGRLYEVEDLAAPPVELSEGEGGFVGILGQSEDLSTVYFVDTAVLPGAGANQRGEGPQSGQSNVYVWHGGAVSFVAGLAHAEGQESDWALTPGKRTAEASPDGRWLAFVSRQQLTGYDNNGPHCELTARKESVPELVPGPCSEVLLYDSSAGRLICASCNPGGAVALGSSFLPLVTGNGAAKTQQAQPDYLTDQGRLLFDSQDSLAASDSNGGVEDVYEWEPRGVGSCTLEFAEGGCVALISGGAGTADSDFVAMDPSGANVFFSTRDRLSSRDRDELIDLYDAREGGGIVAEHEIETAACGGEACQSPTTNTVPQVPGTQTFTGPGNLLLAALPVGAPKAKVKVLTRVEKLAGALRVCRRKPPGRKRTSCEKQARKHYGPKHEKKPKKTTKKRGR